MIIAATALLMLIQTGPSELPLSADTPVRVSETDPTGATMGADSRITPDTVICRTEKASGSMVRKRTVCRTKREWSRAADEGRDAARLYQERVGTPGP